MTVIISDEAVNIALNTWLGGIPAWRNDATERLRTEMRAALTAALPFLPVQGAVKKLAWGPVSENGNDIQSFSTLGKYVISIDDAPAGGTHYLWIAGQSDSSDYHSSYQNMFEAKAAAQADYDARILSALEPSAARELALEEAAEEWSPLKQALWRVLMDENLNDGHYIAAFPFVEKLYAAAIRALSSPDHIADAGKLVEGDGAGCSGFDLIEQVEALIRQNTRLHHGKPTDQVAADIIALVQGKMTQVAYLRPRDIERLATPGVSGAINVQIANTPFIGCTVPVFTTLPSAPSEGAE